MWGTTRTDQHTFRLRVIRIRDHFGRRFVTRRHCLDRTRGLFLRIDRNLDRTARLLDGGDCTASSASKLEVDLSRQLAGSQQADTVQLASDHAGSNERVLGDGVAGINLLRIDREVRGLRSRERAPCSGAPTPSLPIKDASAPKEPLTASW